MTASTSLVASTLLALLLSACTTTPEKYKSNTPVFAQPAGAAIAANNSKMQAVATANIGVPQQYIDRATGLTAQLVVESEYFSAAGRTCRRFQENVNGKRLAGVGCQSAKNGWTEVPLSTLLR